MGLHIMRYRADAVGGTLTVDSKPNDGTTITCRVPTRLKSILCDMPMKSRQSNLGSAVDII